MKPSLLTIARRALSTEAKLPEGSSILVAVSGGPDSMALLHVLAKVAPELDLSVAAHGVDHGLRPAAKEELDRAKALAAELGVPFGRTRIKVARGGNLQARAREARWRALVGAARKRGAVAIATAHHADDRAETVLMRLLRGAGAVGLAAMPARGPALASGEDPIEVLRPLLRARRADILAHVARHAVPYALDPSNEDPRFLRVRVRREVLPLLETLDPGIVAHLNALADELGSTARSAGPSWLAALPRRTRTSIEALLQSRSTTARVWLPGGLVVGLDPRAKPARAAPSRAKDFRAENQMVRSKGRKSRGPPLGT